MASGVKVDDEVVHLFNDMKVHKTNEHACSRTKVAVFRIRNNAIRVDEKYSEEEMADGFEHFKGLLKPKDCCYILYDCNFETKECGGKSELVMTTWCDENAPIKDKMVYSASKDALRQVFKGIKHMMQMNDLSDCGDRDCFAEKIAKDITSMEGKPLCRPH